VISREIGNRLNPQGWAIQIKLDELLTATATASDRLIG
jgi:hypothetical protein